MKRAPKKKAKERQPEIDKNRSQKVNRANKRSLPRYLPEGAMTSRKVICSNMECKLRRAGCYGYEGCPGYKSKE